MNWIKENKTLAAILTVMIAGAVGIGAWLYLSYDAYTTSVANWTDTSTSVTRLKSAKLYPNEQNVEAKEKVVSDYADQVGLLRASLLSPRVQKPVTPTSETEFQAKLKDRASAVRRKAEGAQMLLPADFALGFEEYTGSLPRTPEVAAELNVHLDVMESLANVLIDSGVKSLDLLERTKLPTERAAPAPVAPPKRAPASRSRNKNSKTRTIITEAAAAEPVLDRYPIKMMLTLDQGPFQNLMNTLNNPSQMTHFLVTRLLRVENEKQDGPLKSEIRISREGEFSQEGLPAAPAPEPSGAAPGSQVIVAPKPAAADSVTIMGEEKLKVYLEVDYIRFRPVDNTAGEDEAPATVSTTAKS
jgi:hypothetical protein